jgi:hypothetical protein
MIIIIIIIIDIIFFFHFSYLQVLQTPSPGLANLRRRVEETLACESAPSARVCRVGHIGSRSRACESVDLLAGVDTQRTGL